MAIKTTRTKATSSQTTSEIDLFDGVSLPRQVKRDIAAAAGELIVDAIQSDLDKRKSSVTGGAFTKLDSDYAKIKRARGGRAVPDLLLSGEMRSELDANVKGNGRLDVGVFGGSALKADGHNNLSGKSQLPLRQFLPKEGQEFRTGIRRELQSLVNEAVADNVNLPYRRLGNVQTKAEFYGILREKFGDQPRARIKLAIMENPTLFAELQSRNLTRFL